MKIKKIRRLFFRCISNRRVGVCFLFCSITHALGFCQGPIKSFTPEMFGKDEMASLKAVAGANKKIPVQYENQILLALSYFPELINTRIEFRFKHANTLFSSKPSLFSVFRKRNRRKYIITISDSSKAVLIPLQLKNLDYNAQIGVLGHEISHTADFNGKNSLGLLRVAWGNLSQKFLDRFEFKTDGICVAHGLGYQLLAWSSLVRTTTHYENWTGSVNIDKGPMLREKYMNPSTIKKAIDNNPLYREVKQ